MNESFFKSEVEFSRELGGETRVPGAVDEKTPDWVQAAFTLAQVTAVLVALAFPLARSSAPRIIQSVIGAGATGPVFVSRAVVQQRVVAGETIREDSGKLAGQVDFSLVSDYGDDEYTVVE
jgi:hypothetical protein